MRISSRASVVPLIVAMNSKKHVVQAFVGPTSRKISARPSSTSSTSLHTGAPQRLPDNVDGPLYVNDKCINCSACSMFAPDVFQRNAENTAHIVYHQPSSEDEIESSRAALSACPVAAIRTETQAQRHHRGQPSMSEEEQNLAKQLAISPKLNGRSIPFPRLVSPNIDQVYFVGHHNDRSFGAAPYLFHSKQYNCWIMIDTPRYSQSAVNAIETITGQGIGPAYLIMTHVDDTADHNKWKEHYGSTLKQVFHSNDLGRYNWIGDKTLEEVEILLKEETNSKDDAPLSLQAFDLHGNPLYTKEEMKKQEVIILHTPGHSPGSVSILYRSNYNNDDKNEDGNNSAANGVLFTGDTYGYRLSSDAMTGYPRYGNDRRLQSKIIESLVRDFGTEWDIIAPGHGHVRDYSLLEDNNKGKRYKRKQKELQPAMEELLEYASMLRR